MPFLFEDDTLIRIVDRGGEPWFAATDICRILNIKQATRAVEPLDADEKGVISIHTPGGNQDLLIVSEGGLYTLILRSRLATAPGSPPHRFRKWVTSELLPSIRKTGRYEPSRTAEETKSLLSKLQLVREARLGFGKAAGRRVWLGSGLPIVPEMLQTTRQQGDFIADLDQSGPPKSADVN
jgi:prophage antirepressor-like protein